MTAGWWIFAFLVIITYARNLGPPGGYQYNFVEEMVQNPDFHFGVIEGGATYQLMNVRQYIFQKQISIIMKLFSSPPLRHCTSKSLRKSEITPKKASSVLTNPDWRESMTETLESFWKDLNPNT